MQEGIKTGAVSGNDTQCWRLRRGLGLGPADLAYLGWNGHRHPWSVPRMSKRLEARTRPGTSDIAVHVEAFRWLRCGTKLHVQISPRQCRCSTWVSSACLLDWRARVSRGGTHVWDIKASGRARQPCRVLTEAMVETRTGARTASMPHPQPANRVSVACDNCHTRRCRCSGTSPCHACEGDHRFPPPPPPCCVRYLPRDHKHRE